MRLNGKVAVVTGASMGIGEAIAKVFADEGASVVLSSRDLARVEESRARIGHPERTMAVACNVRNREEIERLLSLTLHNFNCLDIWVNNAGYGLSDRILDMDMQECRRMFDTNFFGAIDGMQVAGAVMKRQGFGTIINISSVAGHIPLPFSSAYSATKFALNAMSAAARMELAHKGVHVMTVCPGFINTNFASNVVRGKDMPQAGNMPVKGPTADRVARAVLRGYLKRKREVVVPAYYRVFMKFYQLAPKLVELGAVRFLKRAKRVREPKQAEQINKM